MPPSVCDGAMSGDMNFGKNDSPLCHDAHACRHGKAQGRERFKRGKCDVRHVIPIVILSRKHIHKTSRERC
ncbi:hypothetical protein QE447_000084 [Stenotrophomonas sp. SORGH_AS282]|nr:hypothetical protein [Stenotrophomonas sp. SORGH_AS_0282]MDQ1187581.1 hypothetical protein [Stenotrophomonas sp. SORGH_AS_0282]